MPNYDAAAVLGKAYDFTRKCFPEHMYESLRVAAGLYQTGECPGGIVVCGAADIKVLEQNTPPPVTEAAEMWRYLVEELHIPSRIIHVDDTSTSTPDNFLHLLKIARDQSWERIFMPMATRRIPRAMFLGTKICYNLLRFTVVGVHSDYPLTTEEKLLGDMVCTLKNMKWGDYRYLLKPDGSSRWNDLRKLHHACEFYQPTDTCEPFKNFHPESLMTAYGTRG